MRRALTLELDARRQQLEVSTSLPAVLKNTHDRFEGRRPYFWEAADWRTEVDGPSAVPTMPTLLWSPHNDVASPQPWSPGVTLPVPAASPEFRPEVPEPISSGRWERLQRQKAISGSFLWEARKRVNQTRTEAKPVPLETYWVNYQHLDAAQTSWYYYWRTRFRAGEALPTDLSYIILNAYEVLHAVGFERPEPAFAYLQRLWQAYRGQHPKCDHYLVNWLTDFIHYYELDDGPAQTWVQQARTHARGDLAVHYWLEHSDRQDVPAAVFDHLVAYRPEQNKFYRDAEDKGMLDTLMRRAIVLTDEFYQATTGESVFERLKTKKTYAIQRRAFAEVMFEGRPLEYQVATTLQYRQDGRLSKLLTQAVRHAENLARKQAGSRSLLRDVKLPANLAAFLNAHLEPQLFTGPQPSQVQSAPERPRLKLDPGRLAALQQESEEIRQRLLDENPAGEHPPVPVPAVPEELVQPPASLTPTVRPAALVDVPGGHLTNMEAIAQILEAISDAGRDLLRQLRGHAWEQAERDLHLPPGTFASTLIDEVNEAAQLSLGDGLLLQEDGVLIAVEDYRDELSVLLEPPGETEAAPVPLLPGPWQALAEALPPLHLEVLAELMLTDLHLAELAAFTSARHALASAVLEDLNAHALDTIEDILIDPYGDPLSLEDTHRENVRHLLHARGLAHPE
ncbi:MAG: TerB N-terminal domain-containing protein [Deinococcota bacterium]